MILHRPFVLALIFFLLLCSLVSGRAVAETTFITDKISVGIFADKFQRGVALKNLTSGAVVEVIERDGEFVKIRAADNTEGWLRTKYVTTEKPAKLAYQQLMAKHKMLEEKLAAAQTQLSKSQEIEKEKIAMAKVRLELKKAREKTLQLENALKQKDAALNKARADLKASQEKAAAVTADAQQETEKAEPKVKAPPADTQAVKDTAEADNISAEPATIQASKRVAAASVFSFDYGVPLKWSLVAALLSLLAGTYLGYRWLDSKIRKRHGGVRIR
jgi:SH3 domain protein